MKYLKDAYYLNAHLVNQKANKVDIFDTGFYELVDLLLEKEEKNIFEVGFDFGQRLDYLNKNGITVKGGVEFDPNFGLYKKHSDLYNRGWDIRFNQLDFWNPGWQEVVITNHFLDLFNQSDAEILLDKMLKSSKRLYLNENLKLNLPKEGNIYVVTSNKSGNDIDSNSGKSKKSKPEVPSFESLKQRPNQTRNTVEETTTDTTGENDSSGGV